MSYIDDREELWLPEKKKIREKSPKKEGNESSGLTEYSRTGGIGSMVIGVDFYVHKKSGQIVETLK